MPLTAYTVASLAQTLLPNKAPFDRTFSHGKPHLRSKPATAPRCILPLSNTTGRRRCFEYVTD